MSVLQLFDEARLPHFPQIVCHRPQDIEAESMRTIEKELYRLGKEVPPELRPVVYRAVHATADFDYADTLTFSPEVMDKALSVLALEKPRIVTDTKMALSGISRPACEKLGIDTLCFMADDDVAAASGKSGLTRAACSVDKAVRLYGADSSPLVFACGNAPTALVRIRQLFDAGLCRPAFVVGVPVGFVNVTAAKELIMDSPLPFIVSRGRKGGSTVAAAIVNALLYQAFSRLPPASPASENVKS